MSNSNNQYSDAEIQSIIDNIPIVDDILFTTVMSNEEIAQKLGISLDEPESTPVADTEKKK